MYIGHFALGFAAKKAAPKPSLGTLFLATQFLDLLWPLLLLLGWEQVLIEPGNTVVTPLNFTHYPISHGFLPALIWGMLACGIPLLEPSWWKGGCLLAEFIFMPPQRKLKTRPADGPFGD